MDGLSGSGSDRWHGGGSPHLATAVGFMFAKIFCKQDPLTIILLYSVLNVSQQAALTFPQSATKTSFANFHISLGNKIEFHKK